MSSTPANLSASLAAPLVKTALHGLHVELGARMVPFAGYDMPVQYPAGLMGEHKHTRTCASLFDVSHMGQLRITGSSHLDAALALESLIPADIAGLALNSQRYGLLLNSEGGIVDDLMMVNRGDDLFVIINGACKHNDLAYMHERIGKRCTIEHLEQQALLALQGPKAVDVIQRFVNTPIELVFMKGGWFDLNINSGVNGNGDAHSVHSIRCYVTRSGYTGEDGFEISVANTHAQALARALLAQPEVMPAGLGARNSLRLEAGLGLYGHDMDTTTTPAQAALTWSIPKVRRTGGERAGGFPGAAQVLAQIDHTNPVSRQRVGLVALERVPVRDGTPLFDAQGKQHIGIITSGLLAPTYAQPIAMGYLPPEFTATGTVVNAQVRGKNIAMKVTAMPFVPTRYHRG